MKRAISSTRRRRLFHVGHLHMDWRQYAIGAICCFGFTVLFLARSQAAIFFMNNIAGDPILYRRNRRTLLINGTAFVVLFLVFLAVLLTTVGYRSVSVSEGIVMFEPVKYKFAFNYIEMWWCLIALVTGVVSVLYGMFRAIFSVHSDQRAIWYSGAGTILVVAVAFLGGRI